MDVPEAKKLKSSYQPPPPSGLLPPGWTEHKAPTGHNYYYNSQTKQSTYTRPTPPAEQPAPAYHSPSPAPYLANHQSFPPSQPYQSPHNAYPNAHSRGAPPYQQFMPPPTFDTHRDHWNHHHQRRGPPEDRPKRKALIPDCAPWVLVYTKLGRRFVHNPDTQESFWKFPGDVMKAVVEFDRLELDKKLVKNSEGTGANKTPVAPNTRRRRSESLQREDEAALAADLATAEANEPAPMTEPPPTARPPGRTPGPAADGDEAGDSSSEYEEIEVTDDEDDEGDGTAANGQVEDQPVEFDEDDIAYQLAAMGEDYGLDPGEYGENQEETWEEGAEGLPLTDEDSIALFRDMLDDLSINPYTPWEKLLEDGTIIDDERYTILPSTKARKDAWTDWTRSKTAALRAQRATLEKLDPRIPYLSLLSESASPKLYWPEFKRKFKKESAMRDVHLSDKDREKLYREHIARLKLPSSTLKSDLVALLKSAPLVALSRESSPAAMPKDVLTDLRYVSLPAKTRDALVEAHISTLPPAPEGAEAVSAEQQAEKERARRERERREAAMRERERRVDEDKRKRERDLRVGMGRLREGERELERAMHVGRDGLRAQISRDDGGGDGDAGREDVNAAREIPE